MRLGRCYAGDAMDLDPSRDIGAYAGSVLTAHGAKDEIVAARYAEEAYRRYGERCCSADDVELAMVDGAGAVLLADAIKRR